MNMDMILVLLLITLPPVAIILTVFFTAVDIAVERFSFKNVDKRLRTEVQKRVLWTRLLYFAPVVFSSSWTQALFLALAVLGIQLASKILSKILLRRSSEIPWPLVEGLVKQLQKIRPDESGSWNE